MINSNDFLKRAEHDKDVKELRRLKLKMMDSE